MLDRSGPPNTCYARVHSVAKATVFATALLAWAAGGDLTRGDKVATR
jgi:hypothetical protein